MILKTKAGLALALTGLGAALAAPAARADTIVTDGSATEVEGVMPPFEFAETFVVPVGAPVLENYTVGADSTGTYTYQTQIVAWGAGNQPSGTILFTSPVNTIPASGAYTSFTANTGGLTLVGGDTYAILTNSDGLTEYGGVSAYNGVNEGADPGFAPYYDDSTNPLDQNYSSNAPYQQAVSLDFAPAAVPEPSSLAPFAFAALGLGGLMLRAKKRKASAA